MLKVKGECGICASFEQRRYWSERWKGMVREELCNE
jgi:hypothetical protein